MKGELMGYFKDLDDVDACVGAVFREAADHPKSGPKLRAANVVMRVEYTDPDCEMTVRFTDDMETIAGPTDVEPDITLFMEGDIAHRFWQGEYNLGVGLAKGEVKAEGPVKKILRMVPLTKPLFPLYRDIIAVRDAAEGSQS